MQVQLKQPEIVAALKQYITAKGISLKGKEVTVDFTAGRKEGGIFVDISIEDMGVPLIQDEDENEGTPVSKLSVVPSLVTVAATTDEPAIKEELPKEAVKTTSLFS